jgi:hypothetical protein
MENPKVNEHKIGVSPLEASSRHAWLKIFIFKNMN